jgi:hypothetical protein
MSVADVAERERRIYAGGPKIEQVVRERARDARIARNREKVEFAFSAPAPVVPPGGESRLPDGFRLDSDWRLRAKDQEVKP